MLCPYCARDNDKVIDSRPSDAGAAIRRRRECLACGKRFTSYERAEKAARLMVVKRDGRRIAFDPEKVLNSVQAACGKRPIGEDAKQELVHRIDAELHREFEREVPSSEIGRRVAAGLRALDQIAFVRYACEYYKLTSLEDLAKVVDDLQSRPRPVRGESGLFEATPAEPGAGG